KGGVFVTLRAPDEIICHFVAMVTCEIYPPAYRALIVT
ncbi:MAG: hypothetical protein QG605_1875, partial [Euryarchaeota archaeon]|nr:hypothetical protein [Euryarchaeota archaeon]